ncbi:MAG: uroporphyrinogen decarboxylase [Acidimicrobiia bacterium]
MPVWFMRQAGRSLPEYRALRGTGSILDTIARPDIACEVTLQPVRRYGVDVAVLFSDIVVPVHAIGFGVDVVPGRGPVVGEPITSAADLGRLRALEPEADIPHVIETVRLLRGELDPVGCTLLGFAGGPFTVASYLVEGGPSKTFSKVKSFMYADPALWDRLVDRLADLAIAFLTAQVHAGAQAIQLFDSWAGSLSRAQYTRFALPATQKVFTAVQGLGVPGVLFGVGTGELLPLMATSGADIIGVDWRVSLADAAQRTGGLPLQGNLDPAVCLAPCDVVLDAARDVLRDAADVPGHIFNLGHGVLPETDPDTLAAVVDLVHREGLALRREAGTR